MTLPSPRMTVKEAATGERAVLNAYSRIRRKLLQQLL